MRLSEVHIFIAYKLFFSVEKISKHYFMIIFAQKLKEKKNTIFDQNHELTPLKNMQNCDYPWCIFLKARNDSFLSKRSPVII